MKYSAVEARTFLPIAVGCSISCHSDKGVGGQRQAQVRSAASQSHVLKWAWKWHEDKTGEACTWDLHALA